MSTSFRLVTNGGLVMPVGVSRRCAPHERGLTTASGIGARLPASKAFGLGSGRCHFARKNVWARQCLDLSESVIGDGARSTLTRRPRQRNGVLRVEAADPIVGPVLQPALTGISESRWP